MFIHTFCLYIMDGVERVFASFTGHARLDKLELKEDLFVSVKLATAVQMYPSV